MSLGTTNAYHFLVWKQDTFHSKQKALVSAPYTVRPLYGTCVCSQGLNFNVVSLVFGETSSLGSLSLLLGGWQVGKQN